jgi:AraC-like DNA-binding protein
LGRWVQHFWIERWAFKQTAQRREMLPHPSVQLVFLPGAARIYGVQRRRFVRELTGSVRLLGIKFLPGAFYPFLVRPVSAISDAFLPADQVIAGASALAHKISSIPDHRQAVELAAAFLKERLPDWDEKSAVARQAVEEIAGDPDLIRASDLVRRMQLSERNLQRLFHRYVGASPGWIIKRYRLYEAIERLSCESDLNLTALAHNLGYFDQAHFTNDFRKIVGHAPARYANRQGP